MCSEGFLFSSGGSGGGTVFVSILEMISHTTAHDRECSRAFVLCPMRCALRIGLEGGRRGEALWRRAVVIAGGWRRAVVIGGQSLVWVALCRGDWRGEPGLGGAVQFRCPVASCHVMTCHVMSCHVKSCHVMSCDVVSCRVVSCRVMSCHVMSCHVM